MHKILSFGLFGLTSLTGVSAQTAKPVSMITDKKTVKLANPTKPMATVLIRFASEVVGSGFTLAEVAMVQSKDARIVAQLKAVPMGTSPLPGYSRTLNRGDIIVKLRAAQIDERQVEIVSPAQFQVVRARNEVSSAKVITLALDAAKTLTSDAPEAVLTPDPLPSTFILPPGVVSIEAGTPRGRIENGTLYVPVVLKSDGKISQTVDVILRVKRKLRVVIANRTLEPNEVLTADDVSLAVIDLPNGFVRPMTSVKESLGKRVKRRVLADAPISATFVETPPLVSTNDRVTLEYAVGVVSVSVVGIARQAGMAGELIRIYLPETHKEIEAFIVNKNTVRLPENTD